MVLRGLTTILIGLRGGLFLGLTAATAKAAAGDTAFVLGLKAFLGLGAKGLGEAFSSLGRGERDLRRSARRRAARLLVVVALERVASP